jgi:[ribosomal protein S5]-alanine N-acetyltransferase
MGPFQTERLRLRGMIESDVPILRRIIYGDRDVWGMYSTIGEKPEALDRAFRYFCNQSPSAAFGRLVVVLAQTDEPIGQVHLDPYANAYYRLPGEAEAPTCSMEVELAFAFGKAHWGRGYATEACRALIDYAFGTLKIPRLLGGAELANDRSVALQRRLGFIVHPNVHPNYPGSWVTVLTNPMLAAWS